MRSDAVAIQVERRVYLIRGEKVMLDFDLAAIDGVSSVLRRRRALQVNMAIMHAFVGLRKMLPSNVDFARKPASLEKKYNA